MARHWLLEARTWKWTLIALLVRGPLFQVFLYAHGLHQGAYGWAADNGDTASYLDPIDSFLAGNAYRPDMRMPGYGIVYLLFRVFTTPQGAGSLIIFPQLLLSALSCVAVMRIGRLAGLDRSWSIVLFWLYTACFQVAYYDVQLLAESFCIAALVLATHDLMQHRADGSRSSLLTSGAWLTWAVFLRPMYAIMLPVFAIVVLVQHAPRTSRRWGKLLLLLLPFLLADGWWTMRNWRMHGHVRPLANSFYYPWSVHMPIFNISMYVRSYGGNHTWWDPSADIRWFNVREGPLGRQGPRADRDVSLPAAALSDRCTIDSLLLLADEMALWSRQSNSSIDRRDIGRRIEARVHRYIDLYRNDRPFSYHVTSRVRMLGHLLARSGQEPIFESHKDRNPSFAAVMIAWNDAWYWTVMPASLVMVMLVLHRWRTTPEALRMLAVILLIGTLVHPVALRLCQGRYLVPMLPFMAVLACALAQRTLHHLRGT